MRPLVQLQGHHLQSLVHLGCPIQVCIFLFFYFFVCFGFCFFWDSLIMHPWLTWNSLCGVGWPWTHRDPLASVSQVLEWKVWTQCLAKSSFLYSLCVHWAHKLSLLSQLSCVWRKDITGAAFWSLWPHLTSSFPPLLPMCCWDNSFTILLLCLPCLDRFCLRKLKPK